MKNPDDILAEMHNSYLNAITESEQPLWVLEQYSTGPLSISFSSIAIEVEKNNNHPSNDEYHHCDCGEMIPLNQDYCSSKCYIGVVKKCLHCNNTIDEVRLDGPNDYCSVDCANRSAYAGDPDHKSDLPF